MISNLKLLVRGRLSRSVVNPAPARPVPTGQSGKTGHAVTGRELESSMNRRFYKGAFSRSSKGQLFGVTPLASRGILISFFYDKKMTKNDVWGKEHVQKHARPAGVRAREGGGLVAAKRGETEP
jgi:hypothetical protein